MRQQRLHVVHTVFFSHGYLPFLAGVVRSRTVVRMTLEPRRAINTSSFSGARASLPGVTGAEKPYLAGLAGAAAVLDSGLAGLGIGLAGPIFIVRLLPRIGLNPLGFIAIYLPFLAVLALSRNALAVGAPLAPGLRIFSPDPAFMRAFLA